MVFLQTLPTTSLCKQLTEHGFPNILRKSPKIVIVTLNPDLFQTGTLTVCSIQCVLKGSAVCSGFTYNDATRSRFYESVSAVIYGYKLNTIKN
jgi:type VI protein secretion system component VasA